MQAIAIFKDNRSAPIKCAYKINGNNPGKIQTIANDYRQFINAGFVELKYLPAARFDPGIDILRRDNKTGFKTINDRGQVSRKKPVFN